MSGGAGHIADMITRSRANESLLKNRSYFKIKEKYLKTASAAKIEFRKASIAELEIVRKMIRADLKKEKQRRILALVLSLIVSAVMIYGFLILLNTNL